MLSFEDKVLIKNLWECVSVEKAYILNTTCKKQLTWLIDSLCWVIKYCDNWLQNVLFYVVLVLSGSVEKQLG